MKKPTPLARRGGETSAEMFSLVGQAISWWEAVEDTVMGLFRALCGDLEPVAMEAFVQAPRRVRESMLVLAMQTYQHRFIEGEIARVHAVLKQMGKLSARRNEIAHGVVAEHQGTVGGTVVAEGHYLLPSRNENGPMVREHRFHYTPETLHSFIADVRGQNGAIQDIYFALMMRDQEFLQQPAFNNWGTAVVDVSHRLVRRELNASDAMGLFRRIIARMDRKGEDPSSA
jgi:hypothetical protein